MAILSLSEARKILGDNYQSLTDSDIERLIENLDGIAHACIKQFTEGMANLPENIQKPNNAKNISK